MPADRPIPSPGWRLCFLTLTVIATVLLRVIPHPWNFTPVGALALFGGACFADRRLAFLLPMGALFIGDLFIGLHVLIPVVYASFAVNVLLGRWLRSRRSVLSTAAVTLIGSVQFFIITNLGSWWVFDPHTLEGLIACYVAAIPYFKFTLLGDGLFVAILFGGWALLERGFPALREPIPQPAAV
ncbi:DUF6580 family putative transport protein [Zavarzinella formosa]|uniref:DUF6580 family putative transport protein n=1 Tax=Zavarzinella formosa TaxID=360055 RepID=UPI00036BC017|nr:DUF6580 family putative transport protein [Zavarzinella formosa]